MFELFINVVLTVGNLVHNISDRGQSSAVWGSQMTWKNWSSMTGTNGKITN